MNIALLGYGVEGQAAEKYFRNRFKDVHFDIFENKTPAKFATMDYSSYDIILRSPSVPPFDNPKLTSLTKYFFDHCPCPIIGVTATKGKGTTCSFIKSLLDAENADAYLVGNIGTPAIDVLDQLKSNSVVVYELSSFQLWDLEKSPHVSVIGQLEPDHINVHGSYENYLEAKSHIATYQTPNDYCIYYSKNPTSVALAEKSPAHKIPYPFEIPNAVKNAITLPGIHNEENAIAAIAAVSAYKNISPDEYLREAENTIIKGLENFHGLPHRLEFIRELNRVRYYDDNFSTNPSSTRVAVNSFLDNQVVIIIGGRDKTNNEDLPEIYEILKSKNIARIILIGESGHALATKYQDNRFRAVNNLEAAVTAARLEAEALSAPDHPSVVLMSPSAASFDMFLNVYDRGDKFQKLVRTLQ